MNAMNLAFFEIKRQENLKKITPLFPSWKYDYEDKKNESNQIILSPLEYQERMKYIAYESNL